MNKGGLKQVEFQFTAQIGAVSQIKHKLHSKFYLIWKITHESQNKQITSTQYLQPDRNGVIGFSTQLKANIKIIYNKDTNTYLKKKSMLCLNYIDDNQSQPKLGGLVPIDLAQLASKSSSSGFIEYNLQRSPFKNSSITIKIISKKIKQQSMSNFNWDAKQLSFESLFDKTKQINSKTYSDKKSIGRKSINKINDQLSQKKRMSTDVNEQSIKEMIQKQRVQTLLNKLKQQNQDLLIRVVNLQTQNLRLKQLQNNIQKNKNKKDSKNEILQQESLQFSQQIQSNEYNNLIQENKYILQELQKVSLKLAKRQQQMSIIKCQHDKLKKKEKKQKQRQKQKQPKSNQLQNQLYYLSQQVMRLHQQLANYRQTEIQNNELKQQKSVIQSKLIQINSKYQHKQDQISKLKQQISDFRQTQKSQQEILDIQNMIDQYSKQKGRSSMSTTAQSLRSSIKQGLSQITHKYNNQSMNSKIQDISNQLLKLKNLSLNGMTMQNKKNFLTVVKKLQTKVSQAAVM